MREAPPPAIDAHHHIWRQADLPWLAGEIEPRIFGDYAAIRRDYPIEEFRADVAGSGVEKSVYVQANWAADRAEDEVAWVEAVAGATGWPHAIVGYCDMTAEDCAARLRRLQRFPRLRGIRQQFHHHENPLYRFAARPDLATDPVVRRNVARLADHGLTFELQVFAHQMADAAGLAAAAPGVTFVLQHAGMLEDPSPAGLERWRTGLARLAERPNVVTKLSAFGTFIRANDPEHIAFVVREAVETFGPERCLFGSNFPIEKLWTTYPALIEAHRAAVVAAAPGSARAIFHDNAARIYRI